MISGICNINFNINNIIIFRVFYLKFYTFINDIIFKALLEKYFKAGYLIIFDYNNLLEEHEKFPFNVYKSTLGYRVFCVFLLKFDLFFEFFLRECKCLFYYNFYNIYIGSMCYFNYLRCDERFFFGGFFLKKVFFFNIKVNLIRFISRINLKSVFSIGKFYLFLGVFLFKNRATFKIFVPVDFIIKKFIFLGVGVLLRKFIKWCPWGVRYLVSSSDYKVVNFFSKKW